MKKYMAVILFVMAGLFIYDTGFTQEFMVGKIGDTASKAAENERINAFMVEKIIGSQVINGKGETLGKIENLVIDIDAGKIAYAVIGSGGFLGMGDKNLPVPWQSLAAIPSEGIFFLNISKEEIAKAPTFDKSNLPDIGDTHWGEDIYNHYGIPGYARRGGWNFAYNFGYGNYHPPVREDPYTKIFDPKTVKTFSGDVISVDHVPEPAVGMDIRLVVFVNKKEVLSVYLGPEYYIEGSEQGKYFKSGDKVIVTGSQVTIRNETFIIASTVKRGAEVLRLRDEMGLPDGLDGRK